MDNKEGIYRLYLRVSPEDQAREGFSLSKQKERLEALCKFKDYKIYYCKINTVIALKLDRIPRSIYA